MHEHLSVSTPITQSVAFVVNEISTSSNRSSGTFGKSMTPENLAGGAANSSS